MIHFKTFCGVNKINPQVLFYNFHISHFDDRAIHVIHQYHIKPFILKAIDSVNDPQNENGPNIKLKGLYGQARMNWQIQHGTLKFKTPHTNAVLVETWISFQLSSSLVIANAFKKTKFVPLNPPEKDTNTQACLAEAQTPKGRKGDEIEVIARSRISPEYVVVISTTEPIVVLIEKVKVGSSRNLLMRKEAYDTVRHRTVLPLQQIKETEMEIRTRRMVRMYKKYGEREPRTINP